MTAFGDPLDLGEEGMGRIRHNSQVPAWSDEVKSNLLSVSKLQNQNTISGIKGEVLFLLFCFVLFFTPLVRYIF